jgi:hypothetical protein
MTNLNKLNKYYKKNKLLGIDINNNYMKLYREYSTLTYNQSGGSNNIGIETNLELYSPQFAGESSNIWPLISKNWKKNNILGIRDIHNSNINFLFVHNNQGKIDEPILGRGTFTAVYQLKNEVDKSDLTKYILRLYMRDTHISEKHMVYNEKIINEYNLYRKYLIKIYYYGDLKIIDQEFKYNNNRNMNLDTYKFKENTQKMYNFDHIITKVYNTPTFDDTYHVIGLTNIQKFTFLYNNLVMLYDLHNQKSFHADYKIGNVGWDDNTKMDVILIDYDIDTIQHVDNLNHKFIIHNGYVTSIKFPSTYIPDFIKDGNGIKSVPLEQYRKYSIGGLHNIMQVLNIEFTEKEIELPVDLVSAQKIKKINTSQLGKSLNLLTKDYNDIPEYSEMLAIFGWLYLNKKVQSN